MGRKPPPHIPDWAIDTLARSAERFLLFSDVVCATCGRDIALVKEQIAHESGGAFGGFDLEPGERATLYSVTLVCGDGHAQDSERRYVIYSGRTKRPGPQVIEHKPRRHRET